MYHFVYKTTNLINGKYYYGVHSTDDLNDGYMGSGRRLKRAIHKYNEISFKREIIQFFDNYVDAYLLEADIVTKELVEDENCYNLTLGGYGGWYHINKNRFKKETKEEHSRSIKEFWKLADEEFRKFHSMRTKEGMTNTMEKQIHNRELWFNSLSNENKKIIYNNVSKGLKKFWNSPRSEGLRKRKSIQSKEWWAKLTEKEKEEFSEQFRGYNNGDFRKRFEPLYLKLKDEFIHLVVDTQMIDSKIRLKLGKGFKFYRLLNYLIFLGDIEIVDIIKFKDEHSFTRTEVKKTLCKRPNEEFKSYETLEKAFKEKECYMKNFNKIVNDTINYPDVPDYYIMKSIGIKAVSSINKHMKYFKLIGKIKDYYIEKIEVLDCKSNYENMSILSSQKRLLQKTRIIL